MGTNAIHKIHAMRNDTADTTRSEKKNTFIRPGYISLLWKIATIEYIHLCIALSTNRYCFSWILMQTGMKIFFNIHIWKIQEFYFYWERTSENICWYLTTAKSEICVHFLGCAVHSHSVNSLNTTYLIPQYCLRPTSEMSPVNATKYKFWLKVIKPCFFFLKVYVMHACTQIGYWPNVCYHLHNALMVYSTFSYFHCNFIQE